MANTIALNNPYPVIEESERLYARSTGLIPAHTQTLAKGPGQYVKGVAPKYLVKGKGAHVWDVDGNEFIDWTMGVGPLSLGYAYDKVDDAIAGQLAEGITFSMMHPLEVEVAELVRSVVPNAECVRYSKTGADVTSAAVRLARAFTGRKKVLCCGYHGWHDWYISVTDRNRGIPSETNDLVYTINYNDLTSLEDSLDDDIACVILEPMVFEEPRDGFLQKLRQLCTENRSLLVLDEMWTGFRLALGGAQEYFNVRADLACFSKAVANGMPLSLLTGRADVMQLLDKEVFFFTTFGGETLSLAAAKATIEELRDRDVPGYLAEQGKKMKDGFNKLVSDLGISFTVCSGMHCRSIVTFNASFGNPLEMKSLMQQELLRHGVLWGGFHNMSYGHTDADIAHTLSAYAEVLPLLKRAVERVEVASLLRGEPVEPVFRKTGNFNMKPKKRATA